MRAVLDVNVVISGLLSREGAPARVLLAWQEGYFELSVSPALMRELERALAYTKIRAHISAEDASGALRWLAAGATTIDDPPPGASVRSKDAGDDYLIALAAAGRAALVSGDKHLLVLREHIPVYSPKEFLELLPGV